MATSRENRDKKKMTMPSSSKSKQQKAEKCDVTDLSQKESSNVGKGPAGENL